MKSRIALSAIALSAVAAQLASMSSARAAEYVVELKFDDANGRVSFDKPAIAIQPGDTVTWVQRDGDNAHDIVAYPTRIPEGTAPFRSPLLEKLGQRWSMTFAAEGTYEYHCHPHEEAGMRGIVVVGRPSGPDEFRKPGVGEAAHQHHAEFRPHDDAPKHRL